MALPVMTRPWFEGRDGHTAEAHAATRRWAEMQTEKRELQLEEDALLHERLQPGYAQRRLRAVGEAVAAGRDPAAEPANEARLQQIAKTKRDLRAGLGVLQQQYESAYKEARNEFAEELRPQYSELLSATVEAALALLVAAKAEAEFRLPLAQQDVPFAGVLQGLPLGAAQPGAQVVLWLRRAADFYPELKIPQRLAKAGLYL